MESRDAAGSCVVTKRGVPWTGYLRVEFSSRTIILAEVPTVPMWLVEVSICGPVLIEDTFLVFPRQGEWSSRSVCAMPSGVIVSIRMCGEGLGGSSHEMSGKTSALAAVET